MFALVGSSRITTNDILIDLLVGAICGPLAYRISQRHLQLRGVTPWHLPSWAWGVFCFIIPVVGVLLQLVAQLTTRGTIGAGPSRSQMAASSPYYPQDYHPSGAPTTPGGVGRPETPSGLGTVPRGGAGGGVPPVPPAPIPHPLFGWYPDPAGRHEQRYWDGRYWSEHVRDGGTRSTDPV
jgi:hypothetical protein